MKVETVNFGAGIEVVIPKEKIRPGTKLYLAGPGGFAEATRPFHEKVKKIVTLMGGEPLDPWVLTSQEKIKLVQKLPLSLQSIKKWEELNYEIGDNNLRAIEESSGIVANLDGSDVESGTASEIGAGSVLGKSILGYRGDFRMARENWGGSVCLQVEYFINHSPKGKIIRSIAELPGELLNIWG